jgi:hypothetical protein
VYASSLSVQSFSPFRLYTGLFKAEKISLSRRKPNLSEEALQLKLYQSLISGSYKKEPKIACDLNRADLEWSR